MSKKIDLICIDPQSDFCDPKGALFVPGATEDMVRLASMIKRIGPKLNKIHVTMDSHHVNHIAHPGLWVDKHGNHPKPFTLISVSDVETGIWSPVNIGWRGHFLEYVKTLEKNGRYVLCIWPVHCVIGTWGNSIFPAVSDALCEWEGSQVKNVDYIPKGSAWDTEHYSAVQADVPNPNDPTTQLNTGFIQTLQEADEIGITGEALNFCLANTLRDVFNNISPDEIKKFVLLTDTCSNVPSFESLGENFIKEFTAKGMRTSTSVDYLA
jgi:nicotinamidase-related amidase